MSNRRPALAFGGALLTALAVLTGYAEAQTTGTFRTLYNFAGGDGAQSSAALVIGKSGVLYGTTQYGGLGYGTVFSLTPPASAGGVWTESVLYSFAGGADGASPVAPVVIGSGGTLYGTTHYGGTAGYGTVFSLSPPVSPGGPWTETVLYSFAGGIDGAYPFASVVIGKGGVLYGTTYGWSGGGAAGTVFSLSPPTSPGAAWAEVVLYNFTAGSDGGNPTAPVLIGTGPTGHKVLYGTTSQGGAVDQCYSIGCGTVFSLTPPGPTEGVWTEAVIYNFGTFAGDGQYPNGMVIGTDGVLYGTTSDGGLVDQAPCVPMGCGTVFSLTPPTPPAAPWIENVLYSFSLSDGIYPAAAVVIGSGGVLYGTTTAGGASNYGVVFSLTPPVSPGGVWTESVLHSFTGHKDGGELFGGLAIDMRGSLYGTTYVGGASHNGTVFKLKP